MAKPIFIAGFPPNSDPEAIHHVYYDLDKKLGDDYHVLTYRANGLTDITFNVLNVTNATDIEISELIKTTREEVERILIERPALDLTGLADEIIKKNKETNANTDSNL